MTVTLFQVLAAARRRAAPITGECAGYLILAAADQMVRTPCEVSDQQVHLVETGAVRIAGATASNPHAAEAALRSLLDALMLEARSGSAALMRIGRRAPVGEIAALVRELEVALIPANRAAAQRSLARLYRETLKAVHAAGAEHAAASPEETARAGQKPPVPSSGPGLAESAPPPLSAANVDQVPATVESVDRVLGPPERVERKHSTGEADSTAPTPGAGALAEHNLAAIDVEFSPVPPAPAALSQVDWPTTGLQPGTPAVHDSETPVEPAVRRRASSPPSYVPEIPDIHKTPYLGTVVAPVSELLVRRGRWPDSLGRAGQSHTSANAPAALDFVSSAREERAAERTAENDVTDPMPPVEEWLDSEELEDVIVAVDEVTADAPLVHAAADVVPRAADAACELGSPAAPDMEHVETLQGIQPTLVIPIDALQHESAVPVGVGIEPEQPWFGSENAADATAASESVEPVAVWTPPVEAAPVPPAPPRFTPRESNISELLGAFQVQASEPNSELVRGLKELAGISVTPPPVRVFEVPPAGLPHPEPEPKPAHIECPGRRANG